MDRPFEAFGVFSNHLFIQESRDLLFYLLQALKEIIKKGRKNISESPLKRRRASGEFRANTNRSQAVKSFEVPVASLDV